LAALKASGQIIGKKKEPKGRLLKNPEKFSKEGVGVKLGKTY
jgi:hypothetical protein